MRYNVPTPSEFLPVAEEMCPQFKCAMESGDKDWQERALLTVLLNRKRTDEGSEFLGQLDIRQVLGGNSPDEEHVLRRAKIYELLGLHNEAIRLMDSLHAHQELV